jgi:hypothetical protein
VLRTSPPDPLSAVRYLPDPEPSCGEGEGVQEGVGGRRPSTPSTSPALPLRFILQSAGVSTQGAPPLRCGVRREWGLRAGGGSKLQPAAAPVVTAAVAWASELVKGVAGDNGQGKADAGRASTLARELCGAGQAPVWGPPIGSVTPKRLPPSGLASTQIRPPWASTASLEKARPSPDPSRRPLTPGT